MMEAIRSHRGLAAPLPRADVDTDQIIPKQFLKRVERTGFGQFLFNDWRKGPDGNADPSFVLNRPEYEGATVLLVGRNFGCGSSREHAAWALLGYGFRVVIAPSFADIFRENADQNGLATIELPERAVDALVDRASEGDGFTVTVELESQQVEAEDGLSFAFEMDEFRRTCLMEGLDRIGLTLRYEDDIAAFERARWPEL